MGYTTGDQAGRNQLKTLERHAENHNRWYMGCTLPGAACPCAYAQHDRDESGSSR